MTNSLKIKIECLNSNKIINALVDEGVLIENLKIKSKYITFDIGLKDENKLKKVCKKFHKKYEVIYKNILKNKFIKLKYFFGFFMSMVLIISLILSFNLYIYEINVSFSTYNNEIFNNINQYLKDNDVKIGMRKNDVSITKIQNLILETQDNVAGCTVSRNGGKLNIMIYPGMSKNNFNTNDIISKYNAVITKVDIYSGKTNIKVGDVVKQGDVLIENDSGAYGSIFGKVYFSDYVVYNENQTIKVATDNFVNQKSILLFNKTFFNFNKIDLFSNYFEEKCVFYLSKNMFLPISFCQTKYIEFKYEESVVKFEDVEFDLKENLYHNVVCKIEDVNTIKNVSYSVVKEDNLVRLDCFIECEIDLTKY